MSALVALRKAVKDAIGAVLVDAHVQEHAGAFSLEEAKRFAVKNPAILVTCQGVTSTQRQATVLTGSATMAAFVLTSDTRLLKRDALAMTVAEQVASIVTYARWGEVASGSAQNVALTNLYSKGLDEIGVSLWAVKWDQAVDFERAEALTLDDLALVTAEYDIGGLADDTVNATDTVVIGA